MRSWPSPPTASRRLLSLVAALFALGGCQPSAPASIDLAHGGQLRAAMTNPDLAAAVQSYVAAMFFVPANSTCGRLLSLTPAELETVKLDQPSIASAQVIRSGGGTDDTPHAFGDITAPGLYAFMMLGSRRSLAGTNDPALIAADGSTIAMGCRQVEVEPGERYDLDITLFPAGLR